MKDDFTIWDAWLDEETQQMYVISIFNSRVFLSQREFDSSGKPPENGYSDGYEDEDSGYDELY